MRDHRMRTRIVGALAGAAIAAVLAAGSALAANHSVGIAGFSFSPRTVTVRVGDKVTWDNSDAQSHTATADDGSFDTGPISRGATASVTFSTAGTFAYHCSIHPAMTATLVVRAAGDVTPPPTDAIASPDQGSAFQLAMPVVAGGLAGAWLVGFAAFRRRFARPRRDA